MNGKLNFVYWKKRFLTPEFRRMLCNALQPNSDWACPAWNSNRTEKIKNKIQIMQNKCISFYLRIDKNIIYLL